MLAHLFGNPLHMRVAQALIVAALVAVIAGIAHWYNVHMAKEVILAETRALVQVVIVGMVLMLIFQGPLALGLLILVVMVLIAAYTASRRGKDLPSVFTASLYAIGLGAGSIMALMTWLGVVDPTLTSLIPIGSMMIANAMNTSALALERFQAEVKGHVGQIEAYLALGADPTTAVAPYVRAAVQASLIPKVDTMRALGIVWIPGVMTGMLLAGSHPVHAALYQFVIVGMIFAVGALASLISVLFISRRIFSSAVQLVLR